MYDGTSQVIISIAKINRKNFDGIQCCLMWYFWTMSKQVIIAQNVNVQSIIIVTGEKIPQNQPLQLTIDKNKQFKCTWNNSTKV